MEWEFLLILTRNYQYGKISMTRAIAQLGRATHLQPMLFNKVHYAINIFSLVEK